MFARILHADWSKHPKGRWIASAVRDGRGWIAAPPRPVGSLDAFVTDLFAGGPDEAVLAGFDFPIGLPLAYARQTSLPDFPAALDAFGRETWSDFYAVAQHAHEITIRRPFYPMSGAPEGTVKQRQLFEALNVKDMGALTRLCETGGKGLKAASPMFWTLGAASVGKAALHGWQEVIVPARERGARLWPFDGPLASRAAVTLAETYPGDAYGQIGLSLTGKSKMKQEDRQSFASTLKAWAGRREVRVDPALGSAIEEGFGSEHGLDNGFDALVGLFAMIAVATGERASGEPDGPDISRWEGWILGRHAPAT